MRKMMLLLCCVAVLSSCRMNSTVQMTKIDSPPDLTSSSDKATLVIFRETSYGDIYYFTYYLDGKLIGETKGWSYFETSITPGLHNVVTVAENTTAAEFDFKAGRVYLLGQNVAVGMVEARTGGFYPKTLEEAKVAMDTCEYMALDAKEGVKTMDSELYGQAISAYRADVKEHPEAFKDILNYQGVVIK